MIRGVRLSAWWLSFAALGIGVAVTLLPRAILPGVDWPFHVAQVHSWIHLDELPADKYQQELLTPYLAGYALMRFLAWFAPLPVAANLVLFLGVLAYPLALRWLLRECGSDPDWALLGFALAFNNMFFWGFFNYWIALPIGIALLAALLSHFRGATRRTTLLVVLLSVALFWTHLMALAFFLLLGGLLWLPQLKRPAHAFYLGLPIVPCLALTVSWWFWTQGDQYAGSDSMSWSGSLIVAGSRIVKGISSLFGFSPLVDRFVWFPDQNNAPPIPTLGFIIACIGLFWATARPSLSHDRGRWAAWAVVVLLYLFGPDELATNEFEGRLPLILVTASFLILRPPLDRSPTAGRVTTGVIALAALLIVTSWFNQFDEDTANFHKITAAIPSGASAGFWALDGSEHFPKQMFASFAGWMHVKGFISDETDWAHTPVVLKKPRLVSGLTPWLFDFIVVRVTKKPAPAQHPGTPYEFSLVQSEPGWARYQRKHAR